MFEIIVKDKFSAAHRIEGYAGRCADLHGHNWTVQVSFAVEELNSNGMAMDFKRAKKMLGEIINSLDHTFLNDNPLLAGGNPTAERIAIAIYNALTQKVPSDVRVLSVTIWESDMSAVKYHL